MRRIDGANIWPAPYAPQLRPSQNRAGAWGREHVHSFEHARKIVRPLRRIPATRTRSIPEAR